MWEEYGMDKDKLIKKGQEVVIKYHELTRQRMLDKLDYENYLSRDKKVG